MSRSRLHFILSIVAAFAFAVPASAIVVNGPPLEVLYSFSGTDGAVPGPLAQLPDGTFFGATYYGGENYNGDNLGGGTVFSITPDGQFSGLYSFAQQSTTPRCLVLGPDGNLYGSTENGGANGVGELFQVTSDGTVTDILDFDGTTNDISPTTLMIGRDGNLYGVAQGPFFGPSLGSIFKVTLTPPFTYTKLYSFGSTDGLDAANLIQTSDNTIYGAQTFGGGDGDGQNGVIFKFDLGTLTYTALKTFGSESGAHPTGLTIAADGSIYGASNGSPSSIAGTIFKLAGDGSVSVVYTFPLQAFDAPFWPLTLATDGNLYGTTYAGGDNGFGSIFRFDPTANVLTTLHSFDGTDGNTPWSQLVQASGGNLYGTTSGTDPVTHGTLFRLVLSPNITAMAPKSGPVGTLVTIKGVNFSTVTKVLYGVAAVPFTIVSDNGITFNVPDGATSRHVTIVNPMASRRTGPEFKVTE